MIKRRARIQPADEAKLYIESASDKPGLMQRFINADKGRGVFAAQPIDPGAFVLEYRGKLISAEECQSRLYTERESTFLFEFQWQNQQWCLDASKEDGSLGRLVNDNDKSPNCTMKKIIVKDKPHLCLFAVKRIEPGTEIDYNYGDVKWPWRKKVGTEEFPAARVESSTALIEEISRDYDGSIQVGTEEFPAARVESSTALIEEISRDQDGSIQVGTEEFPAARVESSTALIEEISRDQDGSIQIAVVQGISLVNYSESESDEDSVKNCSITPHSDDVLQTNSRKKTILDGVPNVPDPLYDSNESIVEESDDEVVPKLRRTKSILMERLPLSDALFDSSDDTTEDLSTSKSDRASERQRRYCYPSLVGTDNTSGESEEEYVPNPNEESTDSDGSSELSVKESVDMDGFLQEGMEDADLPKEQEKECDLTSPQEDTDVPETHGSEDEVDVRSLQECSSTANELTLKRSVKKRGKKAVIKRSWTPEESAAVNKHLRKFIVMNQVPGKEDCERCIAAEPDALRTRDWKAVKYFIKNRITAVRRKLE